MRKLNLLPQAEKKNLKLAYINRLIILSGAGLILILILILSGLFALKIYLNQKLIPTGQKLGLGQLEAKIAELNKQISVVENFNLNQYSSILTKLNQQTLPEIEWENLQITEGEIQFRGHAQTREQMLEFEKELKKIFPEVISPISNLIKSSDLDFTFNISYDKD